MRFSPICPGRSMAAVAAGVLGLGLALGAAAGAEDVRTWKDASGKFSIKGKYVSAEDGKVTLEQEDGEELEIELKQLCAEDQKYVAGRLDNPFKAASKEKDPFKAKAGSTRGKASGPKTLSVNWSKARTVIAAPAGGDWSATVGEAPAQAAAIKARPVALPPKANFFEGLKGLVVSADGKKAMVGYGWDEPKPAGTTRLVLCDLQSGERLGASAAPGLMAPLALSDDGTRAIMRRDEFGFGNADRLEVWGLSESGIAKEVAFVPHGDVPHAPDRDVKWGAFVDASRALTRSEGGKIVLWEVAKARPIYALDAKGGGTPALSPDRKLLAFTTGKEVGVLDVEKGDVLGLREVGNIPFSSLAFSPSGRTLALKTMDKLRTFDVASGTPLREILLTHGVGGDGLVWTGETHVLVGHKFLIDLENQVRLWQYDGADDAKAVGGTTLFAVGGDTNGGGAIIPASLPHPAALAALKRSMADPGFFFLKPGTGVKVDVAGVAEAGQRDKVASDLADRLRRNEDVPGQAGGLDLVASTEMGKDMEVRFRTFGAPFGQERTYKVRRFITRLRLLSGGRVAWEATGQNNIPFMVQLKEGQTLEQLLKETEKFSYEFFSGTELPRLLHKPVGAAALGTSQVSASGVR